MQLAELDIEQTIVAASTPPGAGLRAVIRLSGPDCRRIAAELIDGPADPGGFTAAAARLRLGAGLSLPISVWHFRGPRSYTGQDMVELHLPGSSPLVERVIEQLLSAGARLAEPGEFTLRAVLAGRIDLTAAEAVAERIAARSDGQLRAAGELAAGALAGAVERIADGVVDLLAQVEAGLDFADEPIEFISAQALAAGLAESAGEIEQLRARSGDFEQLERRPTVALVGVPNAGKSTLANRLTGLERALCSPVAGTTRDVLSAPLRLTGGDVQLLDVAGLATEPSDALDALAQAAARRAAESADLRVVVLDATRDSGEQLAALALGDRPILRVWNKIDLSPAPSADGLAVSAVTGQGIEELRAAIDGRIHTDSAGRAGESLCLNARHRAALAGGQAAIERALDLAAGGDVSAVADLVAQELREAVAQLGHISGRVVTDDILDRIFSRFCLGK